jgi:sec-independent protein translocase protein TatA
MLQGNLCTERQTESVHVKWRQANVSWCFDTVAVSEMTAYSQLIMFGLGIGELLIILVIVLVIFGAGKLPEIGEGLGKGIRNFRKAVKTPDEIDVTPERKSGEHTDGKS